MVNPRGAQIALVLLLAIVGGCRTDGSSAARSSLTTETPPGLADLAYHDFGALSRDGLDRAVVPWKLSSVGILLRAEEREGRPFTRDSLPALLQRYGFLDPSRIANWVGRPPRDLPPAVGLLKGRIPLGVPGFSVEGAAIGCAACHSGTTYDSVGRPTLRAWVGLPSRSINFDAYIGDVFAGTEAGLRDRKAFLARIDREFPEMGWLERRTLKRLVIPRAAKRFAELRSMYGSAVPFTSGPPGHTNGVAALKFYLRPDAKSIDWSTENGFVAVPEISSREMRSAMLVDGAYAPPGADRTVRRSRSDGDALAAHRDSLAPIVAFFSVPALGVAPDAALRETARVRGILAWLSTYRNPAFPGQVDEPLASEGAALFARHCADCHGTYDAGPARPRRLMSYPNRVVPIAALGTDPVRLRLADTATLRAIQVTAFAKEFDASASIGYLAPPLIGMWARGPYLHNGSVPTVWDLLSFNERPTQFETGGHALDFKRLGLALRDAGDGVMRYPVGYRAWSLSAVYDTRANAHSNAGHRYPAEGLSDADRRRLIEYLKTL